MSAPAGVTTVLVRGEYEAELVEVGAGIRALRRGGLDVVDGYAADEMCSAGRGQLLVPWPNRILDGRYEFAGRSLQLALTEPSKHNAIHGLTRWVRWARLDVTRTRVLYGYRLPPQPGYPFELELTAAYELTDRGLRAEITATNVGRTPAPYGHGAHPYLTVGLPVDECELLVPAASRCEPDERGLPGAAELVVRTRYDFSRPRLVGGTALDHAYGDLIFGPDQLARAVLRDPHSGRDATLWADGAYRWLQVFTADGIGDRARKAVAVEPMTCPPNAFNSGIDVVVLAPGRSHVGVFGVG
jgi:aldose 1-epimerase